MVCLLSPGSFLADNPNPKKRWAPHDGLEHQDAITISGLDRTSDQGPDGNEVKDTSAASTKQMMRRIIEVVGGHSLWQVSVRDQHQTSGKKPLKNG
ncbi:hypothetical protein ACLOJK_001784 [Asimina triloba]